MDSPRGPDLLPALLALLAERGLPVEHRRHAAAEGTEHIARLRGEPVSTGVKCLLMKAGGDWTLVALRAHRSLDNRALRGGLGVSKLRFARPEELAELTGLSPGEVPPLGEPLLPFPLVADEGIWSEDRLAFTCGSRTDSLYMTVSDWAELARPRRLAIARSAPGR